MPTFQLKDNKLFLTKKWNKKIADAVIKRQSISYQKRIIIREKNTVKSLAHLSHIAEQLAQFLAFFPATDLEVGNARI